MAQASASRCLKPSGSAPAFTPRCGPRSKAGDHAVDGVALFRAPQAVGAGEKIEVLAHAEIAVERELLRHVAEPAARGRWRAVEVEAVDARRAGGRPQQPAHHLEGGRFAGAVRAEQAEDLAALDRERDVVGGGESRRIVFVKSTASTAAPSAFARLRAAFMSCVRLGWPPSMATNASSKRGFAGAIVIARALSSSSGVGGGASSLMTRRTASPCITPSMISGLAERAPAERGARAPAPSHQEHAVADLRRHRLRVALVEQRAIVEHDDLGAILGLVEIGGASRRRRRPRRSRH